MQLLVNGKEVFTYQMYLDWDIFNPCATVSIATDIASPGANYTLKLADETFDLFYYKTASDEHSFLIPVLAARKFIENLADSYGPFEGTSDMSSFMRSCGLSIDFNGKSQKQFWRCPKCNYSTLLKHCQDFGTLANSNGFVLSTWLDGSIRLFDLESILKSQSYMIIEGTVLFSQASKSWIADVPGKWNLNYYTKDGPKFKEFTILENYGCGQSDQLVSSDSVIDLIERKLSNDFWRKYYTAWNVQIRCDSITIPVPGTAVATHAFKTPFICRGIREHIQDGNIINVTATLCRPLEL